MKYKVEGGTLPVLICTLEQGESILTEAGAMSWMTSDFEMKTQAKGGLMKGLGRVLGGESLFLNEYTCKNTQGEIAFASSFPGSVLPLEITPQSNIILQKKAFLACQSTVELSTFFNKKIGSGFFGGEGFIMQRLSGNGLAFAEVDGHLVKYDLQPGQVMYADTGHLAAMTDTVSIDIEMVKGLKNVLFGGEGLFNTKLTGPGSIWLQTMPISNLATQIYSTMPRSK